MKIVVNGKVQEVSPESTVFQLLKDNGVSHNAAVVELNGEVLKQEQWLSVVLQTGDSLEILIFLGGG